MHKRAFDGRLQYGAVMTAAILSLFGSQSVFAQQPGSGDNATSTPIKHVILIIGENRTFDHIFATYQPVNKGETVWNLLSQGIIRPDGSPGPNYNKALQYRGSDTTTYQLTPPKTPYATLPPALTGGPTTPYVCTLIDASYTGTSCVSEFEP